MKIHRFFADFNWQNNPIVITDEKLLHQIRKVLKLNPGEKVELLDGEGNFVLSEIKEINKNNMALNPINTGRAEKPSKEIHLFSAITKKDTFEWMVQKAVECGASSITPIITERTIKTGINEKRLIEIAKEATEQSGRFFIPEINKPIKLKEILTDSNKESTTKLFFNQQGSPIQKLPKNIFDKKIISIIIGPEGGWSDNEVEMIKKSDIVEVSLGNFTLRAETASIASVFSIAQIIQTN
jgi:16S rRNA (uracil1498-N3)-methyltransferase